ncbi:MAG: antibiotic biosynthesis monooxygenase family protein [Candidatus Aquicultorales bacterium]
MPQENMVVLFVCPVKKGKKNEFMQTWNKGVQHLRNQDGFVDERLCESHDDPDTYVSIQEWTDAEMFRDAASSPQFSEVMGSLPVKEDITVASYSVVSKGAEPMAA